MMTIHMLKKDGKKTNNILGLSSSLSNLGMSP